jgi:hypothetical protein
MTLARAINATAAIVAAACARPDPAASRRADAYAVYAAAIDSFPASARPLSVESQTRPYSLARSLGETSALYLSVRGDTGLTSELIAAYERANTSPETLCDCFPKSLSVKLTPERTLPGTPGPVMLSSVGFDPSRKRALVWVAQSCGQLCGSSALFLVGRRGKNWVVSHRVLRGAS